MTVTNTDTNTDTDTLTPDKVLDCQGLYCPEPLFQAREGLDGLEVGQVLELFADDPAAEEDIKRFVKRTGNELLVFEALDGIFRFMIKRKR